MDAGLVNALEVPVAIEVPLQILAGVSACLPALPRISVRMILLADASAYVCSAFKTCMCITAHATCCW
jgi:hypothetical protein